MKYRLLFILITTLSSQAFTLRSFLKTCKKLDLEEVVYDNIENRYKRIFKNFKTHLEDPLLLEENLVKLLLCHTHLEERILCYEVIETNLHEEVNQIITNGLSKHETLRSTLKNWVVEKLKEIIKNL